MPPHRGTNQQWDGGLTLHGDDDLVHGHGVLFDTALVGTSVRDLQVCQADGGVVLPGVVLHEGHTVLQPRTAAVVDVVVVVRKELDGVERGVRVGRGGCCSLPAPCVVLLHPRVSLHPSCILPTPSLLCPAPYLLLHLSLAILPYPILSHPIPQHPILSYPSHPSHPIPSHPI